MIWYLSCFLDTNSSGVSMGMKSLRKMNAKLEFLSRKNEFLNPKLCKLLCSSLIQPNIGYACIFDTLYVAKKWETKYRLLKIHVSVFI